MSRLIERLEARQFLSAACSTVRIDGQQFNSVGDGDGFNRLVPVTALVSKPDKVQAAVQSAGVALASATTAAVAAATAPAFPITVNLSGSGVTQAVQEAFNSAVAKWQQIITAPLPAVNGITGLVINATVSSIDGAGGVLGQSGPTAFRSGSYLPYKGVIQFDSADLTNLISNGQFGQVVFHEIGHLLGIGTIWQQKGLVSGSSYTGTYANNAYHALGGTGFIPLETSGGSGTAGSHWSETKFGNEIMTGYLNSGSNPTSTITIGALQDLGYTVNYAAADSYTIPGITPPTNTTPPTTTPPTTTPPTTTPPTTTPPTTTPPTTNPPASTGTATVTGLAFIDNNSSGTFDTGDTAIANQYVVIDLNNNGRIDRRDLITQTDASGKYSFSNVPAGTYTIALIARGLPQQSVTVTDGQALSNVNFAVAPPTGSITGIVFNDTNSDGRWGRRETGVAGRTVFLDTNSNGVPDAGELSTTTDANGFFTFSNVPVGQVTVSEVVPGGFTATTPASQSVYVGANRTSLALFGTVAVAPPSAATSSTPLVIVFTDPWGNRISITSFMFKR